MDLRAFGVQPRTWLEELVYRQRDRVLIFCSVLLVLTSLLLTTLGLGQFWTPQFLINLAGG
jgi:energy-coupling factor transport system permease protein